MDFRSTALKLISSSPEEGDYNGPYLVERKKLDFLVRVPHKFKDAASYADELMSGKAIMISFMSVDDETRVRIFDYMNGVSYITKAYVSKVRDNLILYTPETVEVERQKRKTSSLWGR